MYIQSEVTKQSKNDFPSILNYSDPIKYLNDYFCFRKGEDLNFSYEKWSKESGTKSRSHLRLISLGKRALTDDFIKEYCLFHRFTEEEKRHFYLIKYYREANEENIKDAIYSSILEKHELIEHEVDLKNTSEFLEKPFFGVLQVLLGFQDIDLNIETIINLTGVNATETLDMLNYLVKIQFVDETKNARGETTWKSKIKPFKVKDNSAESLTKFHFKNLIESAEQVRKAKKGARCRSIILPISDENEINLKNDIEDFIKKLKAKYGSDHIKNKKLFKINLHAFPITEKAE